MWKKIALVIVCVLLLLVIAAWAHKAYWDARYFNNYDPGAPLNVSVQSTETINKDTPGKAYDITQFTFDGYQGEKVPTLISVPVRPAGTVFPVVIFLHGIGQNKKFLRDIAGPFAECGFVLVSFDQYMQGDRKLPKGSSIPAFLKAFQQRPAKTVNETRRLVDYLVKRPDIDPQRVYLLGASYGAVTGATVLAKDKRIRAGVLTYGGGDFSKLLDSYANHLVVASLFRFVDVKHIDPEKPPLPKLTTFQEWVIKPILFAIISTGRFFLGAADPIHYAADITPTPVYFQNGLYDSMVPAAAGKALQDASKEPKKITWYESDHVGIDRKQTEGVLTDALRWLLDQDDKYRRPEEKITEIPSFEMKK